MKYVQSYTVIGFLSIALVFSADHSNKGRDLIDALIDYTDAKSLHIKEKPLNERIH